MQSVQSNDFKSLKIVMVIDAWYPLVGGGQIHVWEISKQLAKMGNEVVILTRDLGSWNDSFSRITMLRIGHFQKFANIFGRIEFLILSLIYLLKTDFDIIHLHAFSPGLLAPILKLFKKSPIVFTAHGNGMEIAGLGVGSNYLEKLVFYKIPYDLEITVAKNTFNQRTLAKENAVIPNGVDLKRFGKAQRKRNRVAVILYVGRLVYDKGVDLLIEVFKLLKDKNIKLLIVGDGPERQKLERQAEGYKVAFTGKLEGDKLINSYKTGDLLVLPSRIEGMPLRLLEAWAAKIPVIVTDVGDNPIFIKNGENGFLCQTNVNSIKKAIEKAISNKSINKLAIQGYKNVQKYTWENIAKETLNNYRKIL